MAWSISRSQQLIEDAERAYAKLDSKERALLALIAIGEPIGITAWADAANCGGNHAPGWLGGRRP